ncbi:protein psiL-like [Dunckerocampus dactyliophorus]|uniref:protein psiL-like n=1 Tax=Dunckerocampus dactyliophorus TaxID=161453 RepID=UPI0024059A29|nr:protein psiL-like [Dunckerocampus dactyliophorus]
MRMILLLVQLATCCAIASGLQCYKCTNDLGVSYFDAWDWTAKCPLTTCTNAGDQCFITKDQTAGTYQVGCKAACTGDANTKCCNTNGCNKWLDVAAAKQHAAVKTTCTDASSKTLTDCMNAIKDNTLSCYSCSTPLGEDYFTPDTWDLSTKCPLIQCAAGQQCSITKVSDAGQVSYQVGCKAKTDCTNAVTNNDDNTKCCDTHGCNNWLNMADANQHSAVKTDCTADTSSKTLKDCMDAVIKAKPPSCYSCSAPLGANYFTSWDWSAKCTLTTCPNAGDQCSITKVSGAYQVGCKTKAACDSAANDANTKCCDTHGCNNWLDVAADAWKKAEAIKDACSPSSKDLKACLEAIDPTISGGGGLAGGLGLPWVLAISVIVLVVLG